MNHGQIQAVHHSNPPVVSEIKGVEKDSYNYYPKGSSMQRIILASLLLVFSCFCFAVGPSYECEKASSGIEQMICEDDELAGLDYKMAHIYKTIMDDDVVVGRVRLEQKDWLSDRNSCDNKGCIKRAYINRISNLHAAAKDVRRRIVREWDRGCPESPYLNDNVFVRGNRVQFPIRNINLFKTEKNRSREHVLYSNCVSEADTMQMQTCTFSVYEKTGSCYRQLVKNAQASMDIGAGFTVLDSLPDFLPLPEDMLPNTSYDYKYLSFETIKACRYATGTFRDAGTAKTVRYMAFSSQTRTYEDLGSLNYDFCQILQK